MLFNKLLIVSVVSLFISACSNNQNQNQVNKVVVDEKGDGAVTRAVYLSDITFAKSVSDGKFKTDCDMLSVLEKSIMDSSKTHSLNISTGEAVGPDQYELKVKYTEVLSHKWLFMAIRPGSNATVKASIIKDGATLYSTTKTIATGVAFGACDRLEKISVAGGRYISKWLSNSIWRI